MSAPGNSPSASIPALRSSAEWEEQLVKFGHAIRESERNRDPWDPAVSGSVVPEMLHDKGFVLEAMKRYSPASLAYASDNLQADREFVLEAVRQRPAAVKFVLPEFLNDRGFKLEALKQNAAALLYFPIDVRIKIWSDRWFMREAVEKNAEVLEYNGEKVNRDFLLDVVGSNSQVLQYADQLLQADKGFVLKAVTRNGLALQYAPAELRSDREVVLEAVTRSVSALEYASAELRSDREVVREAVTRNGLALQYAPEELRSERGVVLGAVTQNGLALQYASAKLQADRKVVLKAVGKNGQALQYASKKLRGDTRVVLNAVTQDLCAVEYVSTMRLRTLALKYVSLMSMDRDHVISVSRRGVLQKKKLRGNMITLANNENFVHSLMSSLKDGSAELPADLWTVRNRKVLRTYVTRFGGALGSRSLTRGIWKPNFDKKRRVRAVWKGAKR